MQSLSRPRIHFYHPGSWINDPNGLVFADGVYHLFYQQNPYGTSWANIHWGHATSAGALNWTLEGPALTPDASRGLPFSGTAFNNNTPDAPPPLRGLLALFTRSLKTAGGILEEQYLARFEENSMTFREVSPEPVIRNPGLKDFRDPKLWRSPRGWHSVIACGDHLRFYRSDDLITWEETSRFAAPVGAAGGIWECPDLLSFRQADGSTVDVLFVSIGQHVASTAANVGYFVGSFDGEAFHPDPASPYQPFDHGMDFYAVQSWSGLAAGSPRVVGWLGNWAYADRLPGDDYAGCLSLPRSLELRRRNGRWTVAQHPPAELAALRHAPAAPHAESAGRREWRLEPGRAFVVNATWAVTVGDSLELAVADGDERSFFVSVSAVEDGFRLNLDRGELWDTSTPAERVTEFNVDAAAGRDVVTLELYVDTCAVELFFDGGEFAATELVPWSDGARTLVARWNTGGKDAVSWNVTPLEPISIG
ncbi:MAG: glycoside hydrolase family 32 protein [Spirochaetota bacterium]